MGDSEHPKPKHPGPWSQHTAATWSERKCAVAGTSGPKENEGWGDGHLRVGAFDIIVELGRLIRSTLRRKANADVWDLLLGPTPACYKQTMSQQMSNS